MLTNKIAMIIDELRNEGKIEVISSDDSYLINLRINERLKEFRRMDIKREFESGYKLKDIILTQFYL